VAPAPSKSNTGLIVAVVGALVLLLAGGGVGAWFLVKDDGSSSASGGSGGSGESGDGISGDPREEAAKDLQYSYTLYSPSSVSSYCDSAFAFGEGMVFTSRSDCTERFSIMESTSDDVLKDVQRITVSASDFHETQDGTLSILEDELFPAGSDLAVAAEQQPTHSVLVLKDISGNSEWRIIGIAMSYSTTGTVPSDAEELMYKGG
jgi:hypothetical protein